MNMMRYAARGVCGAVLLAFTMLSVQAPAYAGMVGTAEVLDQQQAGVDRGELLAALKREDVRAQLVAMGVDPEAARQRVASLSDAELRTAAGNIQTLPAGGDVLGFAVLIFLVLLFTDIMGYTHVFPFVKKTVH